MRLRLEPAGERFILIGSDPLPPPSAIPSVVILDSGIVVVVDVHDDNVAVDAVVDDDADADGDVDAVVDDDAVAGGVVIVVVVVVVVVVVD